MQPSQFVPLIVQEHMRQSTHKFLQFFSEKNETRKAKRQQKLQSIFNRYAVPELPISQPFGPENNYVTRKRANAHCSFPSQDLKPRSSFELLCQMVTAEPFPWVRESST